MLVNLVNSILGDGKRTSKGNIAYKCPKCHHHNNKLEINFDESSKNYQSYQCWVCGFKGKKISPLFRLINPPKDKFDELYRLTKTKPSSLYLNTTEPEKKPISLPKEFITLSKPSSSIEYKKAYKYIKSRNITDEDIIKYNLGYCESGIYKNMIIIPSYNEDGNLNFFTSRSYEKEAFRKYINPDYSRNIVPFDNLINWNSPVILCEGVFDAIAIKRNAIPLLGKNIQNELLKKIISSNIKHIYIALDDDAKEKSIKYCEYFLNQGIKPYLIELDGKDPSEIGFKNFTNLIQTSKPLNTYSIIEKKISLL